MYSYRMVGYDMAGGAHPLQRSGGLLWQQLLADLRRRLADGEFAAAFPGELALVAMRPRYWPICRLATSAAAVTIRGGG